MQRSKKHPLTQTSVVLRKNTTLMTHTIISVVVATNIVIDKKSDHSDKIFLAIVLFFISILGLLRFLNLKFLRQKNALFIGLYYLLSAAGLIFFAPIGSTFTYAWLLVTFFALGQYGLKSALGSLLLLAASLEMQLLWQSHIQMREITTGSAAIALIQFGVISVALILSLERKV